MLNVCFVRMVQESEQVHHFVNATDDIYYHGCS